MGQFKPMVKMETTEPSVELKLKKGGHVSMKGGKGEDGHKKMADGGSLVMPARGGAAPAAAPQRPPLMARRRAMRGLPAGAGPAAPVGQAARMMSGAAPAMPPQAMPPQGMPTMKKGGDADTAQDKAMIKKAMKQHDAQEHKGGKGTKLSLKSGGKMATGGVVNGQGGFATGGVVNGQGGFKTGGVANANGGGYKKGGKVAKMAGGGILDAVGYEGTSSGSNDNVDKGGTAASGLQSVTSGANTIGGALKGVAQQVGMKRGGKASKKAYAAGGTVNSGHPVAMSQGRKPAAKPVRINELAGTYKAGGKVVPGDNLIVKNPEAVANKANREIEDALNPLSMVKELAGKAKDYFMPKGAEGVTKTKESVTVTPGRKRGGSVKC